MGAAIRLLRRPSGCFISMATKPLSTASRTALLQIATSAGTAHSCAVRAMTMLSAGFTASVGSRPSRCSSSTAA